MRKKNLENPSANEPGYKNTVKDGKPDGYYAGRRYDILALIPPNTRRILDIGCGEGFFGEQLKATSGTEVWGVELNPGAAKQARTRLDKVFAGDIHAILSKLPKGRFDGVLFNDVLEHLPYPEQVLTQISRNIKPSGWIICSVPNVLNINVLRGLLLERDWRYESSGILDKTHLRFFTRKSLIRMFEDLGYTVEVVEANSLKTLKFKLFNAITLGFLRETGVVQWICRVRLPG